MIPSNCAAPSTPDLRGSVSRNCSYLAPCVSFGDAFTPWRCLYISIGRFPLPFSYPIPDWVPGLRENSRSYLPGEIIPDDFHLSRCYSRPTRKSELLSFIILVPPGKANYYLLSFLGPRK